MYTPKNILEWHFNKALSYFFTGNLEYELIFQDSDLHNYYFVHSYYPDKNRIERLEAKKTIRAQNFRPDGILLDRTGQFYVLESKLRIKSQREFDSLVYQSLLYANLVRTPAYDGKATITTYPFLDLLYKAHWFCQKYEGLYTNLREKHQWYFDAPTPLEPSEFENKIPRVIFFLPANIDENRLMSAIFTVRKLSFSDYEQYAQIENLDKKDRSNELRKNWVALQATQFSMIFIDPNLLKPVRWKEINLS